jgi:hypothetical protein
VSSESPCKRCKERPAVANGVYCRLCGGEVLLSLSSCREAEHMPLRTNIEGDPSRPRVRVEPRR